MIDARKHTRKIGALIGIASLAATGGCGNLTAGGATGEAVVVLSGDAADVAPAATSGLTGTSAPSGSGVPSASSGLPGTSVPVRQSVPGAAEFSPAWAAQEAEESDGGDTPEGEVEAEFRLYLLSADGDTVSLTDSDVLVRVDLEGVRESEVADQVVPSATYTGLLIVFTQIEAEVDAGLIINGVPVTGAIEVELEDITLPVTKALNLVIGESDRVSLLIDLNAAQWLQAVNPTTGIVTAQVFADLIAVTVR